MSHSQKHENAEVKTTNPREWDKKSNRLDELGRKKNLTEAETRSFQRDLKASLNRTDPNWREVDRRTEEGMRTFQKDGNARRDFSHQAGIEEHKRWESEKARAAEKSGKKEGEDFRIESVHRHPDGKPVRLDFEDSRRDVITDRKPIGKDESESHLMKKYEKQRRRHVEAYEHSTGRKVKEYQYSLYPSPKDIDGNGE